MIDGSAQEAVLAGRAQAFGVRFPDGPPSGAGSACMWKQAAATRNVFPVIQMGARRRLGRNGRCCVSGGKGVRAVHVAEAKLVWATSDVLCKAARGGYE